MWLVTLLKNHSWALRLAKFNFYTEHIPEEEKIQDDILALWTAPNNTGFPVRRALAIRAPLITEYRLDL
eukprot:IDg11287t1